MCGRFWIPRKLIDNAVRDLPPDVQQKVREAIAEWVADMNRPRFDVRPTNQYPVITPTAVTPMRWGVRTDKSNAVFNARAESLRYPIWRESLALRRGLVPAGGFYEWTGPRKERQPHAIQRADGECMLFGAIWTDGDEPSFSIITTPSTEWMKPLHDRMPLILDPAAAAVWLDPASKPAAVKALVAPWGGALEEFPCRPPSHDTAPARATDALF